MITRDTGKRRLTDQQEKMRGGTGEEMGNRGYQIPPLIQSNRVVEMASMDVDVGPTGQRDAAAADKGLSVKMTQRVKNRGRRKLFL